MTDITPLKRLLAEIQRHIVGQNTVVERLLTALLSDGHLLLEGPPGLAKTKMLSVLARATNARMSRIQFTPDLLPADLVGTEIFRPQNAEFVTRHGPIFANVVLADEINRAPAKVQSALLQAMQERQVTIGDTTFPLPSPFLVLATQNPIEQEGTYPLPEAQLDRFLMKVKVSYPSVDEELQILRHHRAGLTSEASVNTVISLEDLQRLRAEAAKLHVDPKIDSYVVALVQATRHAERFGLAEMLEWGASPRASIALLTCARSLAFIRGRDFVAPDDVKAVAPDVLRHRLMPSFEAEARSLTSDEIIAKLLGSVPLP